MPFFIRDPHVRSPGAFRPRAPIPGAAPSTGVTGRGSALAVAVLACGIAAIALSAASPVRAGEFAPVPLVAPADFLTMSEDGRKVFVAHTIPGKVSVLNTVTQGLLYTINTSRPTFLLERGGRLFVASEGFAAGAGPKITVYKTTGLYEVETTIPLPLPAPVYLSAPGGKDFANMVLAVCRIDRQTRGLLKVDTLSGRAANLRPDAAVAALTVSHSGRSLITQSCDDAEFGKITGVSDYASAIGGWEAKSSGGGSGPLPILRQVAGGDLWFGGNVICTGVVPAPLGGPRGEVVIPDRTAEICYAVGKTDVVAYTAHSPVQEIRRQALTYPASYARMSGSPSQTRAQTDRFDFQQQAATIDGACHLYLFDPEGRAILASHLDSFVPADARVAGMRTDGPAFNTAVRVRTLPELPKDRPRPTATTPPGVVSITPGGPPVPAKGPRATSDAPATAIPGSEGGVLSFRPVPLSGPATFLTMSEDGRRIFVAHGGRNAVSVVDTATEKVETTFLTAEPTFLLERGGRLFVANGHADTISVHDAQTGYKLIQTLDVGHPNPVRISAAQGGAFDGSLTVLCQGEASRRTVVSFAPKAVRGGRKDEGADVLARTYSANGECLIVQEGGVQHPGERGQVVYRKDLTDGRATSSPSPFPKTGPLPILRQVAGSPLWYGGNVVVSASFERVGEPRGEVVIPDRFAKAVYVLGKEGLTVYDDLEAPPVDQVPLTAPASWVRMAPGVETLASRAQSDLYDDQHQAATFDDQTHLYLIDPVGGGVYAAHRRAIVADPWPPMLVNGRAVPGVSPSQTPTRGPLAEKSASEGRDRSAWDVATTYSVDGNPVHALKSSDFAWSMGRDGTSVWLLDERRLRRLDAGGERILGQWDLEERYKSIEESSIGLVGLASDRLDVIAADTGQVIRAIRLSTVATSAAVHPTKAIAYVAVAPERGSLDNPPILEVDLATGAIKTLDEVTGMMVAVSKKGPTLLVADRWSKQTGIRLYLRTGLVTAEYSSNDFVVSYDLQGESPRLLGVNMRAGRDGRRLVVSPDGGVVSYVSAAGVLEGALHALTAMAIRSPDHSLARYQLGYPPQAVAFHPTLDLAMASDGRTVDLFRRSTGTSLEPPLAEAELSQILDLRFSPDGHRLLVAGRRKSTARGGGDFSVESFALPWHQADLARARPFVPVEVETPAARPPASEFRTWTDASGRFKVEAAFVELLPAGVRLQKKDGSTIVVPLERLDRAGQSRARAAAAAETPRRPQNSSGPTRGPGSAEEGWPAGRPNGIES